MFCHDSSPVPPRLGNQSVGYAVRQRTVAWCRSLGALCANPLKSFARISSASVAGGPSGDFGTLSPGADFLCSLQERHGLADLAGSCAGYP
jgi:hypothetical protein